MLKVSDTEVSIATSHTIKLTQLKGRKAGLEKLIAKFQADLILITAQIQEAEQLGVVDSVQVTSVTPTPIVEEDIL